MSLPITRPMTLDEFEQALSLPENRDRRLELIDGHIVEKAMPTEEHAVAAGLWIYYLNGYALEHGLGTAGPEERFCVPDDDANARQPDVSMRLNPDAGLTRRGPSATAPDIIVEIKSPDDSVDALRERARWYVAHSVRLVFLHFPCERIIEAVRPSMDTEIFTLEDTLTGYDVLPGFSLPVARLFPARRGG